MHRIYRLELHCRLDESHLTGEADDVLKDSDTAPVLFSGSRVLEGIGRCLVIAVGPNSAQGQISGMVAGVETSGDELRSLAACVSVVCVQVSCIARMEHCNGEVGGFCKEHNPPCRQGHAHSCLAMPAGSRRSSSKSWRS